MGGRGVCDFSRDCPKRGSGWIFLSRVPLQSVGVSFLTAASSDELEDRFFYLVYRSNKVHRFLVASDIEPRTDRGTAKTLVFDHRSERRRELVLSKSSEWVVDGRKCQGRSFRKRFRKKANKRERKVKKMMPSRK